MLGFSWNGTLSRTAVGATLLLLLFSLPESRFWLDLATGFASTAETLGQAFLLGMFVFVAYALGLMITTPPRNRPDWEKTIAAVLHLECNEATAIVIECRSRWELLIGLSRAFFVFAATAAYNLLMTVTFSFLGFNLQQTTPWVALVACIVFGLIFGKVVDRVSAQPLEEAEKLIGYLDSGRKKVSP